MAMSRKRLISVDGRYTVFYDSVESFEIEEDENGMFCLYACTMNDDGYEMDRFVSFDKAKLALKTALIFLEEKGGTIFDFAYSVDQGAGN